MPETTKESTFATITVPRIVTDEAVKSALCTAFEGGSVGWLAIVGYVYPEGTSKEDFIRGGKFNGPDVEYWAPAQIIPTHDGGALKVVVDAYLSKHKSPANEWEPTPAQKTKWDSGVGDNDGVYYLLLNKEKLVKGLTLMSKLFPKQFTDEFPTNRDDYNGDADTGDIFVQCCLMHDEIEKSGNTIFG